MKQEQYYKQKLQEAIILLEIAAENFKDEFGNLENYEYTWKPIEEFLKQFEDNGE